MTSPVRSEYSGGDFDTESRIEDNFLATTSAKGMISGTFTERVSLPSENE